MALRQSAEDYLETILIIQRQKGVVHSIDVAHHMDFSKPSVSRAVTNLRRDGYLTMQADGALELTEKGLTVAKNIYERHNVITGLLTSLGVSPEVAAADACNVEHVISSETFEKIKAVYYANKNDTK